jgi:hypothetical protein
MEIPGQFSTEIDNRGNSAAVLSRKMTSSDSTVIDNADLWSHYVTTGAL